MSLCRRATSTVAVTLITALSLVVGCGSPEQPAAVQQPESQAPARAPDTPKAVLIRVAAASDLRTALPALINRFKSKSGTDVVASFDSSGHLSEQIKAGAPFDVFLAANQSFVKTLADEKLIVPDSVQPYAFGTLVLAVHRESGNSIQSLADLARPEVKKVAIANPAFAPYGAAGKQALERSSLWKSLEPKIVQAESVVQALQFVQSGNAEAGLVGKAIAGVPEVRVIALDPKLYDPLVQALGVVAGSSKLDAAQAFAGFVVGKEGQEILREQGFRGVDEGGQK